MNEEKWVWKIRMAVIAVRRLGSGEWIFGIAEVDGEEFLVAQEKKESNNLVLISKDRVVDPIEDVIFHSEEYSLFYDERGAYIGMYCPSIGWCDVWE